MESQLKIGAFNFILCQVLFYDKKLGKFVYSCLDGFFDECCFCFQNYETGIIIVCNSLENKYKAYLKEFLPKDFTTFHFVGHDTPEEAISCLLLNISGCSLNKLIKDVEAQKRQLVYRKHSADLLMQQIKDSLMIKDIIE